VLALAAGVTSPALHKPRYRTLAASALRLRRRSRLSLLARFAPETRPAVGPLESRVIDSDANLLHN